MLGFSLGLWFVGEDDSGLRLEDFKLDWELCTDSSVRVSAFRDSGAGLGLRLLGYLECVSLCILQSELLSKDNKNCIYCN